MKNQGAEMELKISAFFPAHNEEANVESLTRKLSNVLSELCSDYEVIIVNDGSTDRTKELSEALVKENPHVRLVNHEVNKGYGAALKSGFYSCRFDWIFFTDGDNQFDAAEISKLAELAGENDFVAGFRMNRKDPFHRKLNAKMWGMLVNMLFRLNIKDVDCAFKLMKKEIVDKEKLVADGAMISTELLARAKKGGYKIAQVGVNHYPRTAGQQSGAKLSVILKAFVELFRLYRKLK